MTKLRSVVSIGSCFGLAVWAAMSMQPSVHAQSADLVLCDRLAADPADPDKPADVAGVDHVAPSDIATAIKFCRIASGTSRRASYELGRAYAAGQQLPAAVAAFRKAADKGSTSAMVELGVMYAAGTGVPKDEGEARKYFERAAAAGNARGASNLVALSAGTGNTSDPAQARALLAKAADGNSAEAQFQLGLMMAQGIGGPQDDVGARAMFEKAATQNHPGALECSARLPSMGEAARPIRWLPRAITSARRLWAMRRRRRPWSV